MDHQLLSAIFAEYSGIYKNLQIFADTAAIRITQNEKIITCPSKIDGLDFQIQWEADLLENLTVMDKEKEQEKIKKCIGENFKTNTGKRIAYNRFILD